MKQPHIPPSVAPYGVLSDLLLPALKAMQPRRTVGRRQTHHERDALKGAKKLCPVYDRVLAAKIADERIPTDALLRLPALERAYIRRARRVRVLDFAEACEREQAAHCQVDPLQVHALITRSPGDLEALIQSLAAQAEATDDLLVAAMEEKARREGRHPRVA